MKKKIVKADQTDKQQIRKDKTAIFSGGLEIMFQNLDFEGGNLIKILEKHEKLIQKQENNIFKSKRMLGLKN